MKSGILVICATALLSLSVQAQEAAPLALKAIPDQARESFAALFDWQRSLAGLREDELFSRFGKPDEVAPQADNSVTKKPMHLNVYRISKLSTMRVTVQEGVVMSVALVIVPYPGEELPAVK